MTEAVPGQLSGIGLRPDPQGILFRPFEEEGIQWGYTLKPEEGQPMIFMNDEWTEFVPKGVWLQMLDLWNEIGKSIKENLGDFEGYLQYPEIKRLVDNS
jgi:hypothetical protein